MLRLNNESILTSSESRLGVEAAAAVAYRRADCSRAPTPFRRFFSRSQRRGQRRLLGRRRRRRRAVDTDVPKWTGDSERAGHDHEGLADFEGDRVTLPGGKSNQVLQLVNQLVAEVVCRVIGFHVPRVGERE
jgi:hypothetical protein